MKPIPSLRKHCLAALAHFLAAPVGGTSPTAVDPADLARMAGDVNATRPGFDDLHPQLQAGDIILVGGNTRFARFVAALTGSRWTHVAICIRDGNAAGGHRQGAFDTDNDWVVEADVVDGVRRVSLAEFAGQDLLVIRPAGLDATARANLVAYLTGRIGHGYDLEHVLGLTWLLVARRLRASLADAGKLRPANPARAICSTLVAHALEAAGLPIRIEQPIATRGSGLSLDHLVPGDFEHAAGMTLVFDSRLGARV